MYREYIKQAGLSVTKHRVALLQTLHELKIPVTIEELKSSLGETMDTSTMYRSLKALVDSGLVYQTDFREGVSYFEFHGEEHHHHFVCTHCKERKKIDLCMAHAFPALEQKHKFTITNHIFEIFGLCKKCS